MKSSVRGVRLYRCDACACGFAVFFARKGPENKGGKGITCPLCTSSKEVEEVDAVDEIGGRVGARILSQAVKWWKSLPSGD